MYSTDRKKLCLALAVIFALNISLITLVEKSPDSGQLTIERSCFVISS